MASSWHFGVEKSLIEVVAALGVERRPAQECVEWYRLQIAIRMYAS